MELTWLLTALLGLIVIFCYHQLAKMKNNYWEKRGVKTMQSNLIFGVMLEFIKMKKSMGEVFHDIYKTYEGEKLVGFFQFFTPNIMIRDPELINNVLIKDFTHFEDRGPPMKPIDIFSSGLANMTGDEWRDARHKLTPSFTSGKLKFMFGSIKDCSNDIVNYLQDKIGEDIEVRDLMGRFIINVIANIAFGLNVNTLNEKDEQSAQFYNLSSKFFKPSLPLIFKFMLTTNAPRIRNFLKLKLLDNDVEVFFKNLTEDIVKQRTSTNSLRRNDFLQLLLDERDKERASNTVNLLSNESLSTSENNDIELEDKELIDQLKNTPLASSHSTKSKEIFTDEFIAAQTFVFISGGSETTAAILSFVLYELAVNRNCQKKLQKEIDSMLSAYEFSYQAVSKMTYLEHCINETFRLHPLAAILVRMCTKDYTIPGTKIVIEKGTAVNIPVIGLHYDPQYYLEPENFNPDRFENADSIPKNVFFSFGAGPRFCIAMRLAMLEMKVILAALLNKYDIKLSKKTKLPLSLKKNSFIVYVDGGMWINFHRREVSKLTET